MTVETPRRRPSTAQGTRRRPARRPVEDATVEPWAGTNVASGTPTKPPRRPPAAGLLRIPLEAQVDAAGIAKWTCTPNNGEDPLGVTGRVSSARVRPRTAQPASRKDPHASAMIQHNRMAGWSANMKTSVENPHSDQVTLQQVATRLHEEVAQWFPPGEEAQRLEPDAARTSTMCGLLLALVAQLPPSSVTEALVDIMQELFHSIYQGFALNLREFLKSRPNASGAGVDGYIAQFRRLTPFFALLGSAVHEHHVAAETVAAMQASEDQRTAHVAQVEAMYREEFHKRKALGKELAARKEAFEKHERIAVSANAEIASCKESAAEFAKRYAEIYNEYDLMRVDHRQANNAISKLEHQNAAHQKEVVHLQDKIRALERELRDARQVSEALHKLESEVADFKLILKGDLSKTSKSELFRFIEKKRPEVAFLLGVSPTTARPGEIVLKSRDIGLAMRIAKELPGFKKFDLWRTPAALVREICAATKGMGQEITLLRDEVSRHDEEIARYRALLPVWSRHAFQEVYDDFHLPPKTRTRVRMSADTRLFYGLGTDEDVPPYLRAEGFVRPRAVSKAESEAFIREFVSVHLKERSAREPLTTATVHDELHYVLVRKYGEVIAVEFAYSFMENVEVFKDDPDFEIFERVLCGHVHPDLYRDQIDMLQALEKCCTAKAVSPSPAMNEEPTRQRGQVLISMLEAILRTMFPEKSDEMQNSLRRTLDAAINSTPAITKKALPDCVWVDELFHETKEGDQTLFVEEVRRQHFAEVMACIPKLRHRLQEHDLAGPGFVDTQLVLSTLRDLDPDIPDGVRKMITCTAFNLPAHSQVLAYKEKRPIEDVLRSISTQVYYKPTNIWIQPTDDALKEVLVPHARQSMADARGEWPTSKIVRTVPNPMRPQLSGADEF